MSKFKMFLLVVFTIDCYGVMIGMEDFLELGWTVNVVILEEGWSKTDDYCEFLRLCVIFHIIMYIV